MVCFICKKEVTVEHTENDVLYLSCLHFAKANTNIGFSRTWTGLINNEFVTIDLTNSLIIPIGDMRLEDKWNPNRFLVCKLCQTPYTEDGHLSCSHTLKEVVIPRPEQPVLPANIPVPNKDYTPLCPYCNKLAIEIGSHQIAGWPTMLKLKCGHNAIRNQESQLITLEEAGYARF